MAFDGKTLNLAGEKGFKHFSRSIILELTYVDIEKDPFPTPQEAEVWFQIGDRLQTACVPLTLVDTENRTAKAALIGESEGKILVSFPPTNFGQTRFYASEEELARIAQNPPNGSG